MAAFLNACRFNPAAGGTTDWTYSSSVPGYQNPVAAGAVNERIYKYRAESADLSQWELGEGAYNSGTGVFARATVTYNSSGTGTGAGQSGAGSKINFTTTPQVAIVALKEDLIAIEEDNNFTAIQQAQARKNIYAAPFDAMRNNNLIVNAGMSFSQEMPLHISFPGVANGGVPRFGADCWECLYNHGAATAVIQTGVGDATTITNGPTGLFHWLLLTPTVALSSPANLDYALLRQKIEGWRMANLSWGSANAATLAYAFFIYASGSGSTGVTFVKFSNSAKTRCYYVEITLAPGWNFFSGTLPGDTTFSTTNWNIENGIGMHFEVFFAGKEATPVAPSSGTWTSTNKVQTTNSVSLCGSNSNTFGLTGVWIGAGTQAPTLAQLPQLMRPLDQEALLCLRYYEKSFNLGVSPAQGVGSPTAGALAWAQQVGASTAAIVGSVRYAVRKRVIPTLTFYNPVMANAQARNTAASVDYSATAAFGSGEGGFSLSATSGAGTSAGQTSSVNWVADARL